MAISGIVSAVPWFMAEGCAQGSSKCTDTPKPGVVPKPASAAASTAPEVDAKKATESASNKFSESPTHYFDCIPGRTPCVDP